MASLFSKWWKKLPFVSPAVSQIWSTVVAAKPCFRINCTVAAMRRSRVSAGFRSLFLGALVFLIGIQTGWYLTNGREIVNALFQKISPPRVHDRASSHAAGIRDGRIFPDCRG